MPLLQYKQSHIFCIFATSKTAMPATPTYSPLIPQNPAAQSGILKSQFRTTAPHSYRSQPITHYSLHITHWTFTFSAKERDSETGLSYFGSRYYSSDLSIWLSVDPMSDKYASLSPYVYCADNPVKLVDPDGLYPKSILSYNPSLGLHGGYKLKQSAAHLLSLVSGVSQELIANTVIQKRAAGQYRPWYSCNSGGGAITVGTRSYTTITFTENWFEDNPNKYEGNGYGLDVLLWLDLLSHEVGHLPQIKRKGGLFPYLLSFVKEYIQYGHDDAPSEIEAEKGSSEFRSFEKFVSVKYGNSAMKDLFESDLSEENKTSTIDKWWNEYKNSTSKNQ